MTTTENNTQPPASTDWDALFNAAVVEPVKKAVERPKFDGEVPDGLKRLVDQALKTGERIVLPCDNPDAYDQVIAMATAHVERLGQTGKVVYGTARYADGDKKKLTHVTFTVGDRRGRKRKAETAETAESGQRSSWSPSPAKTAAYRPAETAETAASPATEDAPKPAARKRGAQQ